LKMIDMHIHVVPPNLPGASSLGSILAERPDVLANTLSSEMRGAGITTALAMGCLDGGVDDPLGISGTLEVAKRVPGLLAIGAADPRRAEPEYLQAVEEVL